MKRTRNRGRSSNNTGGDGHKGQELVRENGFVPEDKISYSFKLLVIFLLILVFAYVFFYQYAYTHSIGTHEVIILLFVILCFIALFLFFPDAKKVEIRIRNDRFILER